MSPTNRTNDARRVYERLVKAPDNELSRAYLMRLCGGSKHRLAQALAQLRADGKDVQCVGQGQSTRYWLA